MGLRQGWFGAGLEPPVTLMALEKAGLGVDGQKDAGKGCGCENKYHTCPFEISSGSGKSGGTESHDGLWCVNMNVNG